MYIYISISGSPWLQWHQTLKSWQNLRFEPFILFDVLSASVLSFLQKPILKESVFGGFIPRTFVFGLVESTAFNRPFTKNPFNFQHFNMSSVTLTVNDESIPFKPIKLLFWCESKVCGEAFCTMFSGTGKMYYDIGHGISREQFSKCYALYAFDLTPDMCGSSSHFNRVQKGNLALEVQFSTPLLNAVSLVCYGEFENLIQMNSDREVISDYAK